MSDNAAVRTRVLALAIPVIAQNLLETMLGVVDTALVGRLGASATAGLAAANQVLWLVIAMLSAISIGSAVLVAQAAGAGDRLRVDQLARQSLVWSGIIGLPLALLGALGAHQIVGIFGLAPDVAQIAGDYLAVTMGTSVVLVGLFIGSGVLRGVGDGTTPMIVSAIANVLNMGLAWALIYGVAGFPALGAVGSAWATFVSRSIALLLLIAVLWSGRRGASIRGRHGWRPDTRVARGILGLGVPAAIEQFLSSFAFSALLLVVARLGTNALAAHQLSFTALSTSFLPAFGFAIAATTLVGQSIGARRIAEGAIAARLTVRWATGWMLLVGVGLFSFAEPVLRVFTSDPAVIALGTATLRVIAIAQPLWAFTIVFPGALRGSGDTRFPLIVNVCSLWLGVTLAAGCAALGAPLPVVWLAFIATTPVAALVYWRRWRATVARISAAEAAAPPGGDRSAEAAVPAHP